MNPELHHKWNAERDGERGSNRKGTPITENQLNESKVLLKQNKPR